MDPKDNHPTLDEDSRKRLKKITKDWRAENTGTFSFASPEKLTLPDLCLLLEHFPPLQALICRIAAPHAQPCTAAAAPEADPQAQQALAAELAQARADLAQAHSTHADLRQQCQDTADKLHQCTASAERLLQANELLQQQQQQLQQQLQDLQETHKRQLQQTKDQLKQSHKAPAELDLLRNDLALAQALGLDTLPTDNTQALIQMVAVLSQLDSLKRLWDTLKTRCEDANRPATPPELTLLEYAMHWHNHNWRTRPYQWITAEVGTPYDYEYQQRSRHTPNGETIAAQLLPGVADGSKQPVCHALMRTRS